MKIKIELKEGFSLHDWHLAKEAIDGYLFREFSKQGHPDLRGAISIMHGPHTENRNVGYDRIGSDSSYRLEITR